MKPRHLRLIVGFVMVFASVLPVSAIDPSRRLANPQGVRQLYGADFAPEAYVSSSALSRYAIRRQGNDSNCDFIAVQNGIQNIGGDGVQAYWASRRLVPQLARDYHEVYYSVLGPNGSDQPFTINNLGAAAEAFIGAYPQLGYEAVLIGSAPGRADLALAERLFALLAERPNQRFAHLWITPRAYSVARRLYVPESHETIDLIYPYHEVTAFVDEGMRDQVVILDGLVGYPYTINLSTLATYMRGFNRALVVNALPETQETHQQAMERASAAPFSLNVLGGPFLRTARAWFGPAYRQWGAVLGQPYRASFEPGAPVLLRGRYLLYEYAPNGTVTAALLGKELGLQLEAQGTLAPGTIQPQGSPLINAMADWAIANFGSPAAFERIFGHPVSGEVWLPTATVAEHILRDAGHPLVQGNDAGFVVVFVERGVLVWSPAHGATLLPLGELMLSR